MPKTPLQNSANADDASEDKHTDDIAGRDAATNLARQKIEEAYASNPPNEEATKRVAQKNIDEAHQAFGEHGSQTVQPDDDYDEEGNEQEGSQPEDSELRIEHGHHTDEPSESSNSSDVNEEIGQSSDWRDKDLSRPSLDDESAQSPEQEEVTQNPETTDEKSSVYDRSHDNSTAYAAAAKQWQSYHSSWQQYYQQYYERYYLTQMKSDPNDAVKPGESVSEIISSEPEQGKGAAAPTKDIRNQLLQKAQERAQAVRKSRHFMPILTALSVAIVFLFLQYNSLLIAQVKAYINPSGDISPQNIIVDPNADIKVGPESKLIIPKINVDAPIIFGIDSYNEPKVQEALKKGVVDYPIPGANAKPGQVGNMPILGHSSNDVFDDGAFKFVFVQLNRLKEGDTFFINYESKRYTYSVTSKEIIDPSQVSKLAIKTDVPMVTLITCDPPGTALKRLIVVAKQIGPDPAAAEKPKEEEKPSKEKPQDISGNSPTVLQRLFQ